MYKECLVYITISNNTHIGLKYISVYGYNTFMKKESMDYNDMDYNYLR